MSAQDSEAGDEPGTDKQPTESAAQPTPPVGAAGEAGSADESTRGAPSGEAPASASTADRERHHDPGGEDHEHHGPYGRLGPRLSRSSPFYLGFVGTLGAVTAWSLAQMFAGARSVLLLVVVAFYLAVGLNPLVKLLERWKLRRGLAVLCVFVLVVGAFALAGSSLVPVVTEQVNALITAAPDWLNQLRSNEQIQQFDDQYQVIENLQSYITSGSLAERLFGGILGLGQAVLGAVFNSFTVLILTLYFLATLPKITGAIYQVVPRSRRDRVRRLGDEIIQRIGAYVGGQLLVALIAGLMTFLFLEFVINGLEDYAVALAIVVGVCGLIPLVGGAVGAVVATSVALVATFDLKVGIYCVIFYLLYQQVENYVIYPRVMEKSVSVPGSVVVVAALLGGSLLGVVGALLAVPTAAAIMLLIREILIPRQEHS